MTLNEPKERLLGQNCILVSQISKIVKNLTGSGLIRFSEVLRVQWYLFSSIDLLYVVRISTYVLKFYEGSKNNGGKK